MNFKKITDNSTTKIWECIATKMKIEYLKNENYFILFDANNFIVWEFQTLKETKQAAKDFINSVNSIDIF